MKKVRGVMNGICECDLCTELFMMLTDDPDASKETRTTTYMLPDGLSVETLKKMFCDLFLKEIEITISDGHIKDIKVLEHQYQIGIVEKKM